MIILMALFSLSACNTADQTVQEMDERRGKLHQRGQTFYCELQALGRKSRQLWDTVARDLEAVIPEDLPKDERKNIIAIRNAGLIRMFEAYPRLPQEVKDRVDLAETEDQDIARQMRMMNDSLRHYDLKVDSFLREAKTLVPDSLESWQKRLIVYNCDD